MKSNIHVPMFVDGVSPIVGKGGDVGGGVGGGVGGTASCLLQGSNAHTLATRGRSYLRCGGRVPTTAMSTPLPQCTLPGSDDSLRRIGRAGRACRPVGGGGDASSVLGNGNRGNAVTMPTGEFTPDQPSNRGKRDTTAKADMFTPCVNDRDYANDDMEMGTSEDSE